jgi:cytochrome P450
VLITDRDKLLWRSPGDPVTGLLRQGVLVVDGEEHDCYRGLMEPLLTPGILPKYVERMLSHVDRVAATWRDGQTVDMLVESRRIALLIIIDALFGIDFWDDMPRMWRPILKAIQYISPGAWIIFPGLPRFNYRKDIKKLDDYLYGIIHARRNGEPRDDLLSHLITAGLEDGVIRDQMLTMLIAGHDTSTSLLAWTFYLLGKDTQVYTRVQAEVDEAFKVSRSSPAGWQPRV